MLNRVDLKNQICKKWETVNFNHNFFDSKTNKLENKEIEEIKKYLVKECENKKMVITGGHFIPNIKNYDNVGNNPKKTWKSACGLAKQLKNNGFDVRVSLILNDVNLTVGARKILFENFIRLPEPFIETMKEFNLSQENDLMACSFNGDKIFSEKKLSNRTRYLVRRKQTLAKEFEGENYCHSSMSSYFIDISEQGAEVSVLVFPICSWSNTKRSVEIFQKLNPNLRHICFFETKNCFS